jgi:hypothetical protein
VVDGVSAGPAAHQYSLLLYQLEAAHQYSLLLYQLKPQAACAYQSDKRRLLVVCEPLI